jgi:hypothetical protein
MVSSRLGRSVIYWVFNLLGHVVGVDWTYVPPPRRFWKFPNWTEKQVLLLESIGRMCRWNRSDVADLDRQASEPAIAFLLLEMADCGTVYGG